MCVCLCVCVCVCVCVRVHMCICDTFCESQTTQVCTSDKYSKQGELAVIGVFSHIPQPSSANKTWIRCHNRAAITPDVQKGGSKNTSVCLFSWYLYCIVTPVLWYILYFKSLPKPSFKVQGHKRTLLHFIFILSISLCPLFQRVQLKCKSALKFHFSFWCYGSYISVFGNFPIPFK